MIFFEETVKPPQLVNGAGEEHEGTGRKKIIKS